MDERTIEVPGGRVRSWRVDGGTQTPMLFLHGGPGGSGAGFASLYPLAADRPLVLFDQLGSRTSEWDGDPSDVWNVERFCGEIDAVRASWGLDEVVLFGHSWGGWLSIDYLCRHPGGVRAAVLADTTASFESFRAAIARRVAELPPPVQEVITTPDIDLGGDRYRQAALEFYRRFVVRNVAGASLGIDDSDDADGSGVAGAVFDRQRTTEVFRWMQGHDELHGDGSLADWDRRVDLGEVTVPTLVVAGRYDHMDPVAADELAGCIPGSQLALLEGSSHCPHLEEPEVLIERTARFLRDVGC